MGLWGRRAASPAALDAAVRDWLVTPGPALLDVLVGPGLGLELVSNVNDIPKGSRLAVSTNLLACLIAVCMRATNQIHALTGSIDEADRRLVAARAILGEWLGGSGGGWGVISGDSMGQVLLKRARAFSRCCA